MNDNKYVFTDLYRVRYLLTLFVFLDRVPGAFTVFKLSFFPEKSQE
jgi:hypothetical protein